MKYPIAFISLSDNADIPSLDYLISISGTPDIAFWRHADEMPANFDVHKVDYTALIQATHNLSDFQHGSQVIAISCTEIPLFLATHLSEHIVGIYWIKDIQASMEIQINDDLVKGLTDVIVESEHSILIQLHKVFKRIKSRKMNRVSGAIDEKLADLLEPTWDVLSNYYRNLLQYDQRVCIT